jgi:hypothetical protein
MAARVILWHGGPFAYKLDGAVIVLAKSRMCAEKNTYANKESP